jgi:Glycosyltransferase family 9 (heptosyltransferase)
MRAQDLMPLAQLEGIDLVNLQSSSEGRELARFAADAIDPLQAPLALDEFAAALAATDVIVSVDTMAAHCAGALGHPVLAMLTDAPAWYWGVGGDKCRWYPSARLFRRGAGADWATTVDVVAAVLRAGRTEPHSVFGHGAA